MSKKETNDINSLIESLQKEGVLTGADDIGELEKIPTGIYELDKILGGGFAKGRIVDIYGNPGSGKGLSLDTPIPTPIGWKVMGDLEKGDKIFGPDGKTTTVTAVSNVHHRECYEILFSDGTSLVADDQHRWVIRTDSDRKRKLTPSSKWREKRRRTRKDVNARNRNQRGSVLAKVKPLTQRVVSTLELIELFKAESRSISIDVTQAVELPDQDLLVDPYILGLWLGDGSSSKGDFTTADPEVVDAFDLAGYRPHKTEYQKKVEYEYSTYGLRSQLKEIGVLNNKHIPAQYMRGSIEQRIALIQGLFDSDGSAAECGVEFTNTNSSLALGVEELLRSLGVRCRVSTGTATLYGKNCGPKYRVLATPKFHVFRIPRKRDKQVLARSPESSNIYIKDVIQVQSVPTKCIQVDNESSSYLAGSGWTTTHNSAISQAFLAQAQHEGICVFIDLENSFDITKAVSAGIDTNKLYVATPDSAEETFELVRKFSAAEGCSAIVIDSMAGLSPEAELAGDINDSHVGLVGRIVSQSMRIIRNNLKKSDTILIGINQVRDNIGGMGYGPSTTPTGGKAFKFYSSTRLNVARTGSIKVGDEILGQTVQVKTDKSRLSPPFQKAVFDLYYEFGISKEAQALERALDVDVVRQSGSWFTNTLTGEKLAQGKVNAIRALIEDQETFEELQEALDN